MRNLCLKSYSFCLFFSLYLHVWIRIHKATKYGSITDPDPQHCFLPHPGCVTSARRFSFKSTPRPPATLSSPPESALLAQFWTCRRRKVLWVPKRRIRRKAAAVLSPCRPCCWSSPRLFWTWMWRCAWSRSWRRSRRPISATVSR